MNHSTHYKVCTVPNWNYINDWKEYCFCRIIGLVVDFVIDSVVKVSHALLSEITKEARFHDVRGCRTNGRQELWHVSTDDDWSMIGNFATGCNYGCDNLCLPRVWYNTKEGGRSGGCCNSKFVILISTMWSIFLCEIFNTLHVNLILCKCECMLYSR